MDGRERPSGERGALGLLQQLTEMASGARRLAAELTQPSAGADFEQRAAAVRAHYAQLGEDPFGLDPEMARRAAKSLSFLYRRYFRTEVFGLENIPSGRGLLIANHSGQIPIDGVIVCLALFLDSNPPRLVRAMVDKWMQSLPFIAPLIASLGQVVGIPDNCEHLLRREELILAFPEGVRGISKPFNRRYQLESFGHGYMRLALRTSTPVIPVGIIGAEEQYISLGNWESLARGIGLPALPLIPQLLVPGGVLPLPTKYRIYVGEPLVFDDAPDDERAVSENSWLVQQSVQQLVDQGLARRRSVFL